MPSNIKLPIIDVSALINDDNDKHLVAQQIGDACREFGFFYISGHGVDEALQKRLESLSRQFFDQPLEEKNKIKFFTNKTISGGYQALGNEITSGNVDFKEHLAYRADPENEKYYVYPDIQFFRETVIEYINSMKLLANKLLKGIALSLGLDENYFQDRYSENFSLRIANYPPVDRNNNETEDGWGIGEHTDYGFLTILKQDNCGGLEVKSKCGWIEATPVEGSFVCNIGDMMDRMTGGLYLSTPHRVRRPLTNRLSIPCFYGPGISDIIRPIEEIIAINGIYDNKDERYDKNSVHEINCTFGEYISMKIKKSYKHLSESNVINK